MNRRFSLAVVTASTIVVAMLLVGAVLGQNPDQVSSDPYRHIGVYTEVFAKIKGEYVEEPDMKNVTLGAINGLLVSLDPFASYLNADQYKQYQKASSATGSVGLLLSRKYGYELSVVDAIPGSPADKAGLATGDIVEAINGISTKDMPLAFTQVLLNGEPGTNVELTVMRLRKPEPTKMTLTRAAVQYPPVTHSMIEPQVGQIVLKSLESSKTASVAAAIEDLKKKGAQKLVLDLRHAAAGSPEEGVALARLFLESGAIASVSGQRVSKTSYDAEPSKVIWKGPLVVLTNRGTANGAEVAAAALLDNKRAQVVGERTYGEAALRKPVATQDGGAIILAVAKFYTPAGKALAENPVTPTVAVADADLPDEESEGRQPLPKAGEDPILKKALEVLAKGGTEAARNTK